MFSTILDSIGQANKNKTLIVYVRHQSIHCIYLVDIKAVEHSKYVNKTKASYKHCTVEACNSYLIERCLVVYEVITGKNIIISMQPSQNNPLKHSHVFKYTACVLRNHCRLQIHQHNINDCKI